MAITKDTTVSIGVVVLVITLALGIPKYIDARTEKYITESEAILRDNIIKQEIKGLREHLDTRFDDLSRQLNRM